MEWRGRVGVDAVIVKMLQNIQLLMIVLGWYGPLIYMHMCNMSGRHRLKLVHYYFGTLKLQSTHDVDAIIVPKLQNYWMLMATC